MEGPSVCQYCIIIQYLHANYTFVIFISRYAVPPRTFTKSPGLRNNDMRVGCVECSADCSVPSGDLQSEESDGPRSEGESSGPRVPLRSRQQQRRFHLRRRVHTRDKRLPNAQRTFTRLLAAADHRLRGQTIDGDHGPDEECVYYPLHPPTLCTTRVSHNTLELCHPIGISSIHRR